MGQVLLFMASLVLLHLINPLSMDLPVFSIIVSVLALLLAFYAIYKAQSVSKTAPAPAPKAFDSIPLRLQAYERLVMLTERLALYNLVSRSNQPGMSAREMQILLTGTIKQEYEYNTTQQIYVTPVAWEALTNLKEQNTMIINQLGSTLPADASGSELNKRILEYALNQQNGNLHTIVLEALNFEARKIMQ